MSDQPSTVPPKEISSFIDKLLKTKDPATVGLRRILRTKNEAKHDFPLKFHQPQRFGTETGNSTVLNDLERRVLVLEKEIIKNRQQHTAYKKKAEQAIQRAFDQGQSQGYQKGYKEGEEKAREKYEQDLEKIHHKVAAVFSAVFEQRKELILQSERGLTELALTISERIVHDIVSINKDEIINIVKKTLISIVDKDVLTITVSPDDADILSTHSTLLTDVDDRVEKVIVRHDDRIEPGGCVIESSSGIVDAQLKTKFQEIREVFYQLWEQRKNDSDDPLLAMDENTLQNRNR